MSIENEMVDGYMAGFSSGAMSLPDWHKGRSAAFKHGWLNGRDDRISKPRERYSVLRARADMILSRESNGNV
ncbi:hypothetical protein ACFTQ9_21165 [Bacillus velezensis]|uniref:hypothetical protein n=1 Tax=Bacillati TaxID=1783272 RepID=UPI0035DDC420